jgi:hypothetical protein
VSILPKEPVAAPADPSAVPSETADDAVRSRLAQLEERIGGIDSLPALPVILTQLVAWTSRRRKSTSTKWSGWSPATNRWPRNACA